MNERIKELGLQAERHAMEVCGFCNHPNYANVRDQKFAKLIAQECIAKIEENRFGDNEDFDSGCWSCAFVVRQHFGIDE